MWKNRNLRSLIDVKRIVCRLEGGAKAENLKHICRALEITPKTKNWNLAAIEVVLKQKRFRQYDTFRPTSQNMTLSYDRFYESIRLRELPQFPGESNMKRTRIRLGIGGVPGISFVIESVSQGAPFPCRGSGVYWNFIGTLLG